MVTAEEKALAKEMKELAVSRTEELALARQERMEEPQKKVELTTFMAIVRCCEIPSLPRHFERENVATIEAVSPQIAQVTPQAGASAQKHLWLLNYANELKRANKEMRERNPLIEKVKVGFTKGGSVEYISIPCEHQFNIGPFKAEDEGAAEHRVRLSYRRPRCEVVDVHEV